MRKNWMKSSNIPKGERRGRKFVAWLFHQAVRDHKPVWTLEDMRTADFFYWEEAASSRTYSLSEALLYAVEHNHLLYSEYLLSRFPLEALEPLGERVCCCPSSAPHLAAAVWYDRKEILVQILSVARWQPSLASYIDRKGCCHLGRGDSSLHLACELQRPEITLLLLGNGASPGLTDSEGLTPLDIALQKTRVAGVEAESVRRCLDHLLLFLPQARFAMKEELLNQPELWAPLLGEETFGFLVGRVPASLYQRALQTVLHCLPPARFFQSIQELPLPHALKQQLQARTATEKGT
ncbi:ankyrin repeat domain-containing protein 9-like [Latimeria chalumnae]|uniref:ankyrin repeat domain-containing protein 9-like n=1 Tax=Latimeria chalumnae TaxID=7897 RepID=UPI00313ECED2